MSDQSPPSAQPPPETPAPQSAQPPPAGLPSPPVAPAVPAAWHPDPYGRYQMRYYDGNGWTEHVSNQGVQTLDSTPLGQEGAIGRAATFVEAPVFERSQAQIAKQAAAVVGYQSEGQPFDGGGTIFTEPVLIVNQKAKIIEVNNEYGIYNQTGQQIGGVTQVGQSAAKKAMRILTSYDQFMTHKLMVHDMAGTPLLQLTRPAKVFKSTIIVADAAGTEIGRIVQQNVFGKIRFGLEAGGHNYGSINAQNWAAWDFKIADHTGAEVGTITKSWAGIGVELFTTADNYAVRFHKRLENPLLSLAVAAAVSVDTALKQDAQGLG